ncbi:hypothetical protein ABTM55_19080, partial [Acinetobacter baumannii]
SDAWKLAKRGFIPALERLPGLSTSGITGDVLDDDEDDYKVFDDPDFSVRECAACKRLHSRATVEMTFKGKPYWPDYKYGNK